MLSLLKHPCEDCIFCRKVFVRSNFEVRNSFSHMLCLSTEARVFLRAATLNPLQEPPIASIPKGGRPIKIDYEAVKKAWLDFIEVNTNAGTKVRVSDFCRSYGIARRTFYLCAKTFFRESLKQPKVCNNLFLDWG